MGETTGGLERMSGDMHVKHREGKDTLDEAVCLILFNCEEDVRASHSVCIDCQ